MSVTDVRNKRADRFSDKELTLRKLLFATDFSAACENAWPYALALARRFGSKIHLIHVIAPSEFASVPVKLLAKAKQSARRNAENQMKRLQQVHGGTADLDVQISILQGNISELLLRFEEEENVDLLVAGTRGHRHLNRLLLGSVAEKLFRQSLCPVLVVPERVRSGHAEPVHRVLYSTDFSSEASAAQAYAMSLSRHFDAQLILIHVVRGSELKSTEDLSQEKLATLNRLQELIPREVTFPGVHSEVAFGEPARNISRVAAEYDVDLIVLAVHAANATAAHEKERTAYRVILSALCPVLTVPRSSLGVA